MNTINKAMWCPISVVLFFLTSFVICLKLRITPFAKPDTELNIHSKQNRSKQSIQGEFQFVFNGFSDGTIYD